MTPIDTFEQRCELARASNIAPRGQDPLFGRVLQEGEYSSRANSMDHEEGSLFVDA